MWSVIFGVIGVLFVAESFRLRRDWKRLGASDGRDELAGRGGKVVRAGDNIVRARNIYWGPYWWGFTLFGAVVVVASLAGTFA